MTACPKLYPCFFPGLPRSRLVSICIPVTACCQAHHCEACLQACSLPLLVSRRAPVLSLLPGVSLWLADRMYEADLDPAAFGAAGASVPQIAAWTTVAGGAATLLALALRKASHSPEFEVVAGPAVGGGASRPRTAKGDKALKQAQKVCRGGAFGRPALGPHPGPVGQHLRRGHAQQLCVLM